MPLKNDFFRELLALVRRHVDDCVSDAEILHGLEKAKQQTRKLFGPESKDGYDVDYVWAGTYHAGSDCMIYRRFKGELPDHARAWAVEPPPGVIQFCERETIDVCIDDELTGGPRRVRLGTSEAP